MKLQKVEKQLIHKSIITSRAFEFDAINVKNKAIKYNFLMFSLTKQTQKDGTPVLFLFVSFSHMQVKYSYVLRFHFHGLFDKQGEAEISKVNNIGHINSTHQ